MKTLAFLLTIVIFLASLLLYKALKSISAIELKRRARSSRSRATVSIHKFAAYGATSDLWLWLVGTASGLFIAVELYGVGWWLSAIFVLIVGRLLLGGGQWARQGSVLWPVAGITALVYAQILAWLHPILSRLARLVGRFEPHIHTGIYEREDLLDLLKNQTKQVDSRISETEIKAAIGALTFGEKSVAAVMRPRRDVEWVVADQPISPVLMDDLHKTGQIRFPVIKEKTKAPNPEVVGTLYIYDLLKHLDSKSSISSIMHRDAAFINESDNLQQALDGFLKSQHHILIVVNNFEEVVGILTMEDVLEQVIGQKIGTDFEGYEDPHAVAAHSTD